MATIQQKIILTLLIVFFNPAFSQSSSNNDWFWQYPKPQGNSLWDVAVLDSVTAVAVGNVGTVIKTTDGGKNWKVKHHMRGTSRDFTDIYFLDKSRGWTTDLKTLYQTTDGGENWDTLSTRTKYGVGGIDFINADTGWVVGGGGIMKTTDGGKSWAEYAITTWDGYAIAFEGIDFVDAQNGWVAGNGFYGNSVCKTTDGGETWTQCISINPIVYGSKDVQFINKDTGWVVGFFGSIIKTTNGGTTWTHQRENGEENIYDVHFVNAETGWTVGVWADSGSKNLILMTTNGGENWAKQNSGGEGLLLGVDFADGAGWTVGEDGLIFKTTNGGKDWISQRDKNYNFTSVYFVDENSGWAVGDSGVILHTSNGGNVWEKQYQNDSLVLSSVFAVDTNRVFSVGAVIHGQWPSYTHRGIILTTINSGKIWNRQAFDTLGKLNRVSFINDTIGFIAVSNGYILKTTDKGTSWKYSSTNLSAGLNNMQFINENVGWASLYRDTAIFKTLDGGENWEYLSINSHFTLQSFDFIDANKGWTVGENNGYPNIFKTIDGGQNWTPCSNAPIASYTTVQFINESTGWATGGSGLSVVKSVIIKTTNGGETWHEQQNPSIGELTNMYFLNKSTGWVVGGSNILKTVNGGCIVSVGNSNGSSNSILKQMELYQNYPNPFNPSTTIIYYLLKTDFVSLIIYDILGRAVTTLVNEKQQEGEHKIHWDAKNLSSGIYFYRLTVGEFSETKKMLLIR